MELLVSPRTNERKNDVKRIRRAGLIPAVIYDTKESARPVQIDAAVFALGLSKVQPGCLPTTVFLLKEGNKTQRALVKEIQYHVTTYRVLHVDFEILEPGARVNVKVPINFTGLDECVGIKLGGMLRQVIRHYRVNCPTEKIPEFTVDLRNLEMYQSVRLKDIELPEGVRPLMPLNEVAVAIVKR